MSRYEQVRLSLRVVTVTREAATGLSMAELAQVEAQVRADVAAELTVEDQGNALVAHLLPLETRQLDALGTFMAYLTATPRHLHAPEVRAFIDGFF